MPRPAAHSRFLTAFEHQAIPLGNTDDPDGLDSAEADHLALIGELRPGFCERGYRSIRLANYCGVLRLGERVLEILPKVDEAMPPEECRGLLLRLLRQVGDFPYFEHTAVDQSLRSSPLLEVFIAAFFDAVAEVVRGGLRRQYEDREDDLPVLRGRVLARRQFAAYSNRPDRIACGFDELTADNAWNRLLRLGLRAVRPWIVSDHLTRRWVELMVAFDEVDDVRVGPHTLNRLIFDRHASRYRIPIDWVRWILELLSPTLRAGQSSAPSLLFDMNKLFEMAVASFLRASLAGTGVRLRAQETGTYLARIHEHGGRPAFALKPDLVLRRDGVIAAIADTKWKRLEVDPSGHLSPNQSDFYQMHAYATAFGCEHLALIYPWHSGLAGSRETAFELPLSGARRAVLGVVCIDIHNDPMRTVRGGILPDHSATRIQAQARPL